MMHQMKDWLGLHGLDVTLVQDVLAAFRAGALSSQPFPALVPPCETDPTVRLSARHECFEDIVVPALACGLDDDAKVMDALHSIEFAALPTDGPRIPHTIDPGRGGPPVVVMEWHGRVDDLACLAHECAHALQIRLSGHDMMPPVAREACAFLGELLLVDHARRHDSALFGALLQRGRRKTRSTWAPTLTPCRTPSPIPKRHITTGRTIPSRALQPSSFSGAVPNKGSAASSPAGAVR